MFHVRTKEDQELLLASPLFFGWPHQHRYIFGKVPYDLWLSPLILGKSCCNFFLLQIPYSKSSKICKINFWIKNDPLPPTLELSRIFIPFVRANGPLPSFSPRPDPILNFIIYFQFSLSTFSSWLVHPLPSFPPRPDPSWAACQKQGWPHFQETTWRKTLS